MGSRIGTGESSVVDKVLLEVMKNRAQAIAEEMAAVVLHTAYTAFVKEAGDFGCCLVSPQGEVFACPIKTGVTLGPGMDLKDTIDYVGLGNFQPGDVIITNDPYTTGGMSTHLPDIFLVKPVFVNGVLLAFGLTFIHSSDVGGKVPGSISPTSYDIYQEGIRIPPRKLYRGGVLDRDLLDLVLSNCRIPDQNWGDLRALISALQLGERRLGQLVNRYGLRTVQRAIVDLLDYGEQQAREIISAIPDGTYTFWDYLEGDLIGGAPIRIRCAMTVKGSDVILDFSGTDHQVRASYNMPTRGNPHHYTIISVFQRYFRTLRPDMPLNAGIVRPVECQIPEGTVLNPVAPAACGHRGATMIRVLDVTMGNLCRALPDDIPTAGAGQGCIVVVAVSELQTGRQRVGVVEPLCGGSGGRPHRDGIDGMDHQVGWIANIPIETVETELPVMIVRYGLRPDTGGAGRYRGGVGLELTIGILTPDTVLTVRGLERNIFRPWGRKGGDPGVLGVVLHRSPSGTERVVGKIDEMVLQPREEISFLTQGGGGYGSPLLRPPHEILTDVENGLVSEHEAYARYGVVIQEGRVDDEATRRRRDSLTPSQEDFVYGPEREAFEQRWPDPVQLALNEAVAHYPPSLRTSMRNRLMRWVEDRYSLPRTWTTEELRTELDELMRAELRTTGAITATASGGFP